MELEKKFRAYSKKFKKMVYADDPKLSITISPSGKCHSVWLESIDDEGVPVMQYIGLKDIHGREIYEGDILNCISGSGKKLFTGSPPKSKMPNGKQKVIFHEGAFKLNVGSKSRRYSISSMVIIWCQAEVIGNIYENPKLLKEKEIKKLKGV